VKTSALQYDLPADLIAQEPVPQREQCRLMVLRREAGSIEHHRFADLPAMLEPRDLLVLNRSKVLPARFDAYRSTGGRIEALFVQEDERGQWQVLLRGRGRLRLGERLSLGRQRWRMRLLDRLQRGLWRVQIEPADPAEAVLEQVGRMPVPPYIRRKGDDPREPQDRLWYQTVFAQEPGSVAAPTAGLHFSEALLGRLEQKDVRPAYLTLHVGLGTFQPIEVEDLAEHQMHAERYDLPPETAEQINARRAGEGRIVAVGTTVVRVLETCADAAGQVRPGCGWTDLFIYPPYRFRAVDALITNFHLPGSTLLALVFAFAGRDFALRAYAEAIRLRYRFYSYGDAMLIL